MDPLSVASAIAGIISAIKGISDANATQEWQAQVSGKLDKVIIQNSVIISELEQLPLLFAIDLQAAFNSEIVIQGVALSRSFDQYMSGRHADIPQIQSIRTPSETLANNIIQRGPCVYQGANAVAVLIIAIHRLLHVDAQETQAFISGVIVQMQAWAGPADGMFGHAITSTSAMLQAAKDALGHEPRGTVAIYSAQTEVVIPGGPHGGGIHAHPTLKVLADIAIDDAALTFSLTNARTTWFDTAHFNDDLVAGQASAWSARIQSEISTIKQISGRLNTLQAHEASLQAMINDLTHWR